MDWSTIFIVVQLIFLESILSIDNAAVLGAMAAPLPQDKPIPWPLALQGLAVLGQRWLGNQREAALKVGLLGAYIGRFLMLLAAAFIVQNMWLRILGALYLVYLAVEHIAHFEHNHGPAQEDEAAQATTDQPRKLRRDVGFWSTVFFIELADLAFSLDNVVAAITLSNKLWVIALGVALGIVAMRFAATLFTQLILWESALQTGAYLLVLSLGVELLLKEIFHFHVGESTQFFISVAILILTILIARSPLRSLAGLWNAIIILFKAIYAPFGLITWILQMLAALFRRKPLPEGH